jgi:hypothetical protein
MSKPWVCLLMFGMGVSVAQAASTTNTARVVVRPKDTGEALVNRGMGWTLPFYSNFIENYGSKLEPDDLLED